MVLRLLACVLLLIGATASRAAGAGEPSGSNCALVDPPNDAGESPEHDIYLRVYPRNTAITAAYSGCQITWAPRVRGWNMLSVTVIAEGDPVRVWLPARPADPVNACRYAKGKLVAGDRQACPSPLFLMPQTVPAGCTALMKDAGDVRVPGCVFE